MKFYIGTFLLEYRKSLFSNIARYDNLLSYRHFATMHWLMEIGFDKGIPLVFPATMEYVFSRAGLTLYKVYPTYDDEVKVSSKDIDQSQTRTPFCARDPIYCFEFRPVLESASVRSRGSTT